MIQYMFDLKFYLYNKIPGRQTFSGLVVRSYREYGSTAKKYRVSDNE